MQRQYRPCIKRKMNMTIEDRKSLLAMLGDNLKQTQPLLLVPRSWIEAFDRLLGDIAAGHDERPYADWGTLADMIGAGRKNDEKGRMEKCGMPAMALLIGARLEEARTGGCIPTETFHRWILECCGLADIWKVEKLGSDVWVRSDLEAEEDLGLVVRVKVLDWENAPSYDAYCHSPDRNREDELDAAKRLLVTYLQRMGAEDDPKKLSHEQEARFREVFDRIELHRKRRQRIGHLERGL